MTKKTENPSTEDREPIDIRQFLAKHRMIGVVWCVEDVQKLRPDLTADQAWEVLQRVEHKHDAELGITWTMLEIVADDLYPEPDNEKEA